MDNYTKREMSDSETAYVKFSLYDLLLSMSRDVMSPIYISTDNDTFPDQHRYKAIESASFFTNICRINPNVENYAELDILDRKVDSIETKIGYWDKYAKIYVMSDIIEEKQSDLPDKIQVTLIKNKYREDPNPSYRIDGTTQLIEPRVYKPIIVIRLEK